MAKDTVEESLDISMAWLRKHDYLVGWKSGGIKWTRGWAGHESSVSFSVDVSGYNYPEDENQPHIRFWYTTTDRSTEEKTNYDYEVRLVHTPCHLGGKRWWFICPLIVEGRPCGRRVGVLYMGSRYFGCRHCLDLTYDKCNESGRFRGLGRVFDYEKKEEKLYTEVKRFRKYYRGKPTKRYLKSLRYSQLSNQTAGAWLAMDKMLYPKNQA